MANPSDPIAPTPVPSVPAPNPAPTATSAPVAPVAPVAPPATGDSVDFDLSKLTPAALLKNKPTSPVAPTAQASPATIPPTPTRDELLQQAAEVPATAFILPPSEAVIEPNVTAAPPMPPPKSSVPAVPPPIQPVQPPTLTAAKPAVPANKLPFPLNRPNGMPVPNSLSPNKLQTQVPASPRDRVVPPIPQIKIGRRSRLPLMIGIIGGLIVIILGIGYVMARGGSRVPLFSTLVTGLPTSGQAVNNLAIDYLADRSSYQFTGTVTLKQPSSTNTDGPPTLPTSDLEAGAVYSLSTNWEKAQFQETGTIFLGAGKLTVNDKDPVNLALQTGNIADESGDWRLYLADANTPEVLGTNSGSVHQTLLYPVLAIPSLESLLGSAQEVTAYSAELDQSRVTYSFSTDLNKLSAALPDQGKFESASLVVKYRTKQNGQTAGVPQAVGFKATLKYAEISYEYTVIYSLSSYDQLLATSTDTNLDQLNRATEIENRTVADFVRLLGILQISALPSTLPEDEMLETPTAVVPTGETVVSVEPSVAGGPIPSQTVSEAAMDRDDQRLQDLASLQEALENYYLVNGSYPVSISTQQVQTLSVLFTDLIPTYISGIPVDPLPQTYYYSYLSDGKTFRLRSIAEDWNGDGVNTGSAYPYYEVTNSN